MMIKHSFPVLVLLTVCLTISCAQPDSDTSRDGDIFARLPQGWDTELIDMPGVRLLSARQDPASPETTPHLLWLEVAVFTDIDPKTLVTSMRERSGLGDAKIRSEKRSRRAYAIEFDSDSSNTPARAAFYAYRTGRKIRMLAFAAPPQRYDALGGSRLPLVTFDEDGSLTRLLEPTSGVVPPSADNAVLVHANGHRLTEKMVTDTLVFAEFLAAGPLIQQDRVALRHEVIAEFPSISEKDYQTYVDIGHLIESMHNKSGVTRAEVRRDIMHRIYFDLKQSGESSSLMDIVYKYNPVLGADEALGLIATRAAYDALLDSNSFVASIAGLGAIDSAQREQYMRDLADSYDDLNEKSKRFLADGEVNTALLMQIWQNWDEANRQKYLRVARVKNVVKPDDVPQAARNLEAWAGIDAAIQDVRKLNGLQGDISTLEHTWHMLQTYGPHQ